MDSSSKALILLIILFAIVNIIVYLVDKMLKAQKAELLKEVKNTLIENHYTSKGEHEMSELKNIKLGKVAKATAIGGVGFLIATIAPLGVAAVGTIAAATAATSWVVDSVNDSLNKKK